MKIAIRKAHYKYALLLIVLIFFLLNFVTIMTFPFVHSDETWLMGLSQTALEHKSFQISEPFFDLYPRAIHGLRIVFISLQSIFLKLFGFRVFSVRLLSLLFGTLSLSLIGILSKRITNTTFSLMLVVLCGTNLQFIMHSKMARQEAILIAVLLMALYMYLKDKPYHLIGVPIGISIGIHPNSFVVALGIGFILLYEGIKEKKLKSFFKYVLTLATFASLFILISFLLNGHFLRDYLAYGETQGVTNFQINRFEGFYYFYYKIYHQIGGTYLLVNNKVNLVVIFVTSGLATLQLLYFKAKKISSPNYLVISYLLFIGINVSLMLIGRYNQTSYIFILISGFLLLLTFLYQFKGFGVLVLMVLLAIQVPLLYEAIDLDQGKNYEALGHALEVIPDNAEVLGNLSYLEFLTLNHFHDYRNLWDLSGKEALEYLDTQEIEYVIWPEEMDYIHNMVIWEILYGPLDYYEDLKECLNQQELVATFENSTYGMRISKYIDTYPWTIKIYKINPSSQ